jgi:hypothetical protein
MRFDHQVDRTWRGVRKEVFKFQSIHFEMLMNARESIEGRRRGTNGHQTWLFSRQRCMSCGGTSG